jgi:RNA polymerase sigma factor (sigma-70 family)
MNDDLELVRQYARDQSEQAFEELVARYIGLVYSAALRQVRDPGLAQEITQSVFMILARKAGSLGSGTILPGWLYRTTRYVSSAALKMERRRERRELEVQMQAAEPETDPTWEQLAPALDEAMSQLRNKDRDAIVLRFFHNKSLREVGSAFGMNEYAAQKRVSRALEKLRKFFSKRGVNSTVEAITGAISACAIQPTPVGLAKTISTVAVAKGAAASASTLTLVKGVLNVMAWTKTQTAIIAGAIALLTVGVATVSIDKILTKPPFVKITGRGQIEHYNNFNKTRVVETADMTIWTDGKSYRISIDSKGDGTLKNDADDLQAQYASDGIDTFVLSDQLSPLHRTPEGFGGFAYAGRFPNSRTDPYFVPLVVQAAWLAYCSRDYFNVSSNHTGLKMGNELSLVWPDYVTNYAAYWTNSTLPQNISGWSRNLALFPRTNSTQPMVAGELEQYPGGFKAWKFTADDPVIVGGRQWPRQVALETFFPLWGDAITNGDNVDPLRKATFVADSITVVKDGFDQLPPVTVPDLQVMDSRFANIAGRFVITSHATPQGWPVRGSKTFKQAEADANKLAKRNRALVQSWLKEQPQVVISPSPFD